jgi:SagB-type dehydrogenase family enzyme
MKQEIYLNPLLKLSNIFSEKLSVEGVCKQKNYIAEKGFFINLLSVMQQSASRAEISKFLCKTCDAEPEVIEKALNALHKHELLVTDLDEYPVEQIEMWKKYRWLNALVYHLKSQNIHCVDDKNTKKQDLRPFPARELTPEEIWKTIPYTSCVKLSTHTDLELENRSIEETLLKRTSAESLCVKKVNKGMLGCLLRMANIDLVRTRQKLEQSIKNFYDSRFIALETYIVVHKVFGVEAGVYFYDPKLHQLCLVSKGEFRKQVVDLCIGQGKSGSGAFTIFITARLKRYMRRYKHERAYRNLLTNTAEFAQQYIFFATAMGLNTWLTPAIIEPAAADLLKIDNEEEIPVYTVAAG